MKIYSSLLTLLISCIGILQVVYVTAERPKINFNGLSQILIPGQYNGISEYSSASQKEIFDSASDSFITQFPNGTFQLVGTSSSNGTINAICILPRSNDEMDVYIGGNFNSIGGITVNNIARYDPSAKTFSPLIEGLDGPVYSLYCDTINSIVYVGGMFSAPIKTTNNIDPADFVGNVAIWRDNAWVALPFKGFNGPVYTIAYNEPNNTIYFGGQFDATGDGTFGDISNIQPINIQNSTITGGNSAVREEFGDPTVITCSAEPDGPGTTWLMRDNIPGFWRAEFSVKVTPSMIGIKNTNVEGRGTKAFRLIATADMSVITLSYMDPIAGLTQCSDSCPLSSDNVEFQMFSFVSQLEIIGIQVDILEWYGLGGGFHGIQLFQSDIVVRAANDNNPSCAVNQFQPKVTVEGAWASTLISGTWKSVLQTTGELSTAKVILQPYIPQAGYYNVTMSTPSCIPIDCSKTTSVDVIINAAPGQTFGPITISQNNPTLNDRIDGLFNVFISATTTFFKPTVEITISATVTAPVGAFITVDSVKFEKVYRGTPLRGLFQYWPPSNLNPQPAWNGFNGILAPLSIVHTIKVLSQSLIVIGGKFNNVTFFNIVKYDGTSFIPFPKGGLNGRVNTLEKVDDDLFIGGLFNNNVLESATRRLNNIAKLSLTDEQWSPVSGGVNDEVNKISLLNNQQIHVAGKFNTIITPQANAEGKIFGNVTSGYVIWDNGFPKWTTSGFVDGKISDIASHSVSGEQTPLTFYAGRILSAQSTTAFGGSLLTSSGVSALPLYPQASNGNIFETIINAVLIWKDNVIIGGKFTFDDNNITNVAILRDGLMNNLGNDVILGEVKNLLVVDDLLYIGSASTAEENKNSFLIYNLNDRIVNVSPQLTANDNNVRVNAIKNRAGTSDILVGGKFDKAGSLECKNICIWDSNLKQWKSLGVNDNLSGEIYAMDLIGKKRDRLVVSGNLTLNGNLAYLLKYDFGKSNWEDMRGVGDGKLPGPAVVVFNDFMIDDQFFVSGYAEDSSAYLRKWTGNNFRNIGEKILPGSKIEALSLLPSNGEHDSVDYLGDDWLLLVSGSLKLDPIGDVSAALYDGKNMYPYIISSQMNGVPGRIFAIFTNIGSDLLLGKKHLPIPVVIAISTVIALSFVFLIFASGMSYRYFKRKRQAKELASIGPRESIKTPFRNSELMATINAAAALIGQQNNSRYSMTSSNNLRNSAFGSNVDVKSLDEAAASGLIGSGAIGAAAGGQNHNQTSTLQNNTPTSVGGERNLESKEPPQSPTKHQSLIVTPADASTGQVWLNGEQAYAYRARYPFIAREEGELGFNAGDTIFVTDTSDEVWWLGWKRLDGTTDEFIRGVFPSNYVVDQLNSEEMPSSVS
ncbi:hypothetical protein RhiirA5_415984 [Rhizophagus irregularis]|uniref:SH3 domain-containing protein n=3 Tax=Rhizophagus irregularis TaxID=588596 RepID=A0A2I1EQ21_9GLOM|nr:Rax2p [Rhizophagus irregularis DAOM 197198w]PKC09194.1 hypothetical protein RhiirA5_415984 [Rhizophagus irregularis]PKY24229.1 hypothetical protein RhiirB3_438708 [Rhizophagus irregularis]UZO29245.1 hypothetical protein OCT59_022729 [Rhizophagus irregularis]CAB4484018.1 unnamed protein product [Rhizophagus irregularis]